MTTRRTVEQRVEQKKDRLWSVSFVLVIFISFFGSMLCNGVNNGIPLYIESIGGSVALSGVLTSIFSLAAAVGRFLGGNLSDKFGRKRIIVIGALLMTLGCTVAVINDAVFTLALCRVAQGVGFAMTTTAAATAAADMLPPSRIGEGIGYHSLSYALSLAFGVALGVALVGWGGGLALFGGFAVLSLVAFVLALICRFEKWGGNAASGVAEAEAGAEADASEAPALAEPAASAAPETPASTASTAPAAPETPAPPSQGVIWNLIEKTTLPVALIQFLFAFGTIVFTCFSALYALHFEISFASMFFVTMAIAMVLSRVFSAKIFDRFSATSILAPAVLLSVVACILMLVWHDLLTFSIAGFVYGLSGGLSMPAAASEVVRRASPDRWGAGNATFWLSMDLGMTAGTLFWGFIIGSFGFETTLAASIVVLAVDLLCVLTVLRLTDPKRRAQAELR
jgi:predicted MFS family arabinose efflux permease